jgi:hypothetical protein
MIEQSQIARVLSDYLGRPFAERAAGPDAYDCWGVCKTFAARVGLPLPDIASPVNEHVCSVFSQALERFVRLDGPLPWSLLGFEMSGPFERHVGLVLPGDTKFLHATESEGVVLSSLADRKYRKRVKMNCYRPRGVCYLQWFHSVIARKNCTWQFMPLGDGNLADVLDAGRRAFSVEMPTIEAFDVEVNGREVDFAAVAELTVCETDRIAIRPRQGNMAALIVNLFITTMTTIATLAMNQPDEVDPVQLSEPESSYSREPVTTQMEGIPIPWNFGTCPSRGNIISGYTGSTNEYWDPGDLPRTAVYWGRPGLEAKYLLTFQWPGLLLPGLRSYYFKAGFGEGPMPADGVVDDGCYLAGELQSNYSDAELQREDFPGTDDQEASTIVGERVEYTPCIIAPSDGSRAIYQMTVADYDDLGFVVTISNGVYWLKPDGSQCYDFVWFKIEIREIGEEEWHVLWDRPIFALSTDSVSEMFRAGAGYPDYSPAEAFKQYVGEYGTGLGASAVSITPGQRHEIAISVPTDSEYQSSRVTQNGGTVQVYLEAVQAIYNDEARHPGLAYSAYVVASEKVSLPINVEMVRKGRIVEIYDSETQSWSLEWSDHWAWATLSVLRRPRIKGNGIDRAYEVEFTQGPDLNFFDVDSFAAWDDFCEEDVPDGYGGTRRRYVICVNFEQSADAFGTAYQMARNARAWLVIDGGKLRIVIDRYALPVDTICMSNLLDEGFSEEAPDYAKTPTDATMKILDATNHYLANPITWRDPKAIVRESITISGDGHADYSQGIAHLVHVLHEAQQFCIRTAVTGPRGRRLRIGDVVYMQHDHFGGAVGGRIVSVDGTTLELSRAVTASGSDCILVQTTSEAGEIVPKIYSVASMPDSTHATISGSFDETPSPNDPFTFGSLTQVKELFRIRALQRTPEGRIKVTGRWYDENYFIAEDGTPPISPYEKLALTMRAKPRAHKQATLRDLSPLRRVIDSVQIGADKTSDAQDKDFLEAFEYSSDEEMLGRWIVQSGDGEVTRADGGSAGGIVMQIGDNHGDDSVFLLYLHKMPYDSTKPLRLKMRVRRTVGESTVTWGVVGYAADGVTLVNVDGDNSLDRQHAVGANGYDFSDAGTGWVELEAFVYGTAATGSLTPSSDVDDPAKIQTGAKYVSPFIKVAGTVIVPAGTYGRGRYGRGVYGRGEDKGFGTSSGIIQIDQIAIEALPVSADAIRTGTKLAVVPKDWMHGQGSVPKGTELINLAKGKTGSLQTAQMEAHAATVPGSVMTISGTVTPDTPDLVQSYVFESTGETIAIDFGVVFSVYDAGAAGELWLTLDSENLGDSIGNVPATKPATGDARMSYFPGVQITPEAGEHTLRLYARTATGSGLSIYTSRRYIGVTELKR